MSLTSETMTPADIAAVTGNNSGFMGGDGAWWIIILFLFAFCGGWGNGWGGNGGGRSGVADNYILTTDFATIERKLDGVNNGLCEGFYTQAQLVNGINGNITQAQIAGMQAANALQAQIAACCCDTREAIAGVNYNLALNHNAMQSTICTSTRDIIDNQNSNARAILDALNAQAIEAKNQKIADQAAHIQSLELAASQAAQNQYLITQLGPKVPVPAFNVAAPYQFGGCCGCGC